MDILKAFFGPKGDDVSPSMKRILAALSFAGSVVFFAVGLLEAGIALLGFTLALLGVTAWTKT